jgi:hypothetical protein
MNAPSGTLNAPDNVSRVSVSRSTQKANYAAHFSPEIIADTDEFLFDEVFADADQLISFGFSLREAARRSERDETRLRLSQLRDVLTHAIRTHKLLSTKTEPAIAGPKAPS